MENFPATIDDGGCYFLSGFDGSIIQLLLGGEQKDEITGEKIDGEIVFKLGLLGGNIEEPLSSITLM